MKKKTPSKKVLVLISFLLLSIISTAQTDTLPKKIPKVHHVEPLYIDLVRDLGARKGEKELNIGGDFINTKDYHEYGVLAEYEFAPINRLGLEIETDFLFFKPSSDASEIPKNKLDKLKMSIQYSFYVSPKYATTLAMGYTHVFAFTDFESYDSAKFITGMQYSPFFIAAKRWGENFHTLILTGPILKHRFQTDFTDVDWQFNASFHYGLPNSSHFIGVEFNDELVHDKFKVTMRPQAKLQLTDDLALGIVAGFPLTKSKNGFSSFFRVIYEL